jgi:hypothetical protein
MQQARDRGLAPAVPVSDHPVPTLSNEPSPAPILVPVESVAPPPAQVLATAPSHTPTTQPRAPAAASPTPVPDPTEASPRRHRVRTVLDAGAPPRDLAAEADYYAIVYPDRARLIRKYGGLPPDCTFGPPDDDLLHAIVTGTSPALLTLDGPAAAAA